MSSTSDAEMERERQQFAASFGHVPGSERIDKAGHTGDAEYGDTLGEVRDLMGWGMTVTAHDMKPWIPAGRVNQACLC